MSRLKRRENPALDLRVRTVGEDLWIWRMSQPEPPEGWSHRRMPREKAADQLGITPREYNTIENRDRAGEEHGNLRERLDRLPSLMSKLSAAEREYRDLEALCIVGKAIAGIEPTPGLLCQLARRRSGINTTDILRDLGVSRISLWAWETSGAPKLVSYWRGRGFVFPKIDDYDKENALQDEEEVV